MVARNVVRSWSNPIIIRRSSTSYTEAVTDAVGCYLLVSLVGDRPARVSDWLCLIPRLSQGQAPADLGIQLVPPTAARVVWTPSGNATGHLLLELISQRSRVLPGSVTQALDETGGRLACYLVLGLQGATPIGISNGVCGVRLAP